MTSDLGFVHLAVSLQPGNVVSNNIFHDLAADPSVVGYGGWGIYLDQGSSFVTVDYNLVYNTSHEGFQYNGSAQGHGTWSNPGNAPLTQVAYNVFAFGAQASIHRNEDDGALDFDFEHNVVYWDTNSSKPVSPQNQTWNCSAGAMTQCYLFASNHYYAASDPNAQSWVFIGASTTYASPFSAWTSAGEDVGSSFTVDPGFVDAANHNFAFKSGAPAGDTDPNWVNYADTLTSAGRSSPVLNPACDTGAPVGLCYVPAFPTQPMTAF